MTLRSSDLQSDCDLDGIRNSCDVFIAPEASAEGACIWSEFGYYESFVIGYYRSFLIGYYGSLVIGYYGSYVMGYSVWGWWVTME